MWITFDKKKIGSCIFLKRKSSAHAPEDRIQLSLEYKVFNLSNGLLIFATFSLSLDFVIDVFMTLETLVKFKGWNQDSSLGPEHAKPRYR